MISLHYCQTSKKTEQKFTNCCDAILEPISILLLMCQINPFLCFLIQVLPFYFIFFPIQPSWIYYLSYLHLYYSVCCCTPFPFPSYLFSGFDGVGMVACFSSALPEGHGGGSFHHSVLQPRMESDRDRREFQCTAVEVPLQSCPGCSYSTELIQYQNCQLVLLTKWILLFDLFLLVIAFRP